MAGWIEPSSRRTPSLQSQQEPLCHCADHLVLSSFVDISYPSEHRTNYMKRPGDEATNIVGHRPIHLGSVANKTHDYRRVFSPLARGFPAFSSSFVKSTGHGLHTDSDMACPSKSPVDETSHSHAAPGSQVGIHSLHPRRLRSVLPAMYIHSTNRSGEEAWPESSRQSASIMRVEVRGP